MGNWIKEFKRFVPSIRVTKFHGNREERVRSAPFRGRGGAGVE